MKNHIDQSINRRNFLARAGALSGAMLLPASLMQTMGGTLLGNKNFGGVNVGVITYSFRSMPGSAEDLLGYLTGLGLSTVELMSSPIEAYAGAPEGPGWIRGPLSDEQKKEREEHQQELKKWRLSVPKDKFKALRKMYNDEGIDINIVKFPIDRISDEEIDYCFEVAGILGAKGLTIERSDETAKKLAPFGDKHKKLIGYHNHAKVDFNSWDLPVSYSKYNALNLDVGHYLAGTNESPIPLIKKYSDRILNLHMKDRKKDNGDNLPWGEGDTPIVEILQLMQKEKYKFMATIELEYKIPEGSDAVKEVGKCVDYCRNALNA
ncbi:MAG: sugar phosphate isomerase/epimerase [Cyclobacteriaceae bacterium]|nr:sugar phosphate isomerase/epimerase [Cyclobacteriaceae bacterium]